MGKIKGWTKQKLNQYYTTYSRSDAKVGEGFTIITIQRVPIVNMENMKIVGYNYSLKTNKTKFERYNSLKAVTKRANEIMRRYPNG